MSTTRIGAGIAISFLLSACSQTDTSSNGSRPEFQQASAAGSSLAQEFEIAVGLEEAEAMMLARHEFNFPVMRSPEPMIRAVSALSPPSCGADRTHHAPLRR